MTDPSLIAMLLGHHSFLGIAEKVDHEIMPIDAQLNFTTGGAALMAMANTPAESDLTVLRAVDPAKHAEDYPDWEERMLNSYVLCEAFSGDDPEITLGWYSRVKLLPISTYRYRQARRWIKEGFPTEPPEWINGYYMQFTDALSQRAPDIVPLPPTCVNCGGREINLKITRNVLYEARTGSLLFEDDQRRYVPLTDVTEISVHEAKLVCPDCGDSTPLDDEEWVLPGTTN